MTTLTTARAVVSMLEVSGIDTIFCLPGVQKDAFFDALYAVKLFGGAQRPLIVVGGGAQGAGEHIACIAEMLDAPVMTGRRARA